jgi:hypothetical protein
VRTIDFVQPLKWVPILALLAAGSAPHSRGAPASAPQPATPVLWFIFVDDLHLTFMSTGRIRTLLTTISGDLIQDGDMAGIVSTGPSSIAVDLTSDRQRIARVWGRVTGSGLLPVDMFRASQAMRARGRVNEVWYRAAVSMSTAYDTMVNLARVRNMRKAFIYLSNGYDMQPPPDGSAATLASAPSVDISADDVRDHFLSLTDQARRANVRIFAIDPRRVDPGTPDPSLDRIWWQNYWATSRNSLREMSERSGGFALLEDLDLAEGLKRISHAMRQ